MICRKIADNVNENQETESRTVFFGSKGIDYRSKNMIYNCDEKKFEEYFEGAGDIYADEFEDFYVLTADGASSELFIDSENNNFMPKTGFSYKYERDENGNLILYKAANKVEADKDGKINSYINGRDAVSQSLTQRLSLLEGELYHYIRAGFPSFKKANKNILDSYVVKVILNHPEVKSISSYQSRVENRIYYMNADIVTIYGELDFSKRQYM